jgi:hypothetical protein
MRAFLEPLLRQMQGSKEALLQLRLTSRLKDSCHIFNHPRTTENIAGSDIAISDEDPLPLPGLRSGVRSCIPILCVRIEQQLRTS